MIGNRHFASRHFQKVFPTDTGGGDGVIYVVGAVVMRRVIQLNRAVSASGSVAIERARVLLLSFGVVGSVVYEDAVSIFRLISIGAVGLADMTKNVIYGGGGAVRRGVWAIKARLSRLL